jgi:bacterioferritin
VVTANQELLDGLNHALNREVSTFLRYMLQSARIKGAAWEAVRETYRQEIPDELRHAQYLADKIVMLGGAPHLDPDLTEPPTDVTEMLEHDIEQEQVDVEHYLQMSRLAEQEGLADLKVTMENQAADEAHHAERMRRLLGM